jgi:tetratricopeptide (TPR) repeat protein
MAKKKRRDRRKRRGESRLVAPVPGWVNAQIEDLLEKERPGDALNLIEEWGEKRPNHPILSFYLGCAHLMMDDSLLALKYFRTARRLDRRNEAILPNLMKIYIELGFFTHGLRTLKLYQGTELALEGGDSENLHKMRATLEGQQREAADHLDVGLDLYQEANYWDEEARISQLDGENWDEAIAASNKALSILPECPHMLNNRAMSCYFAGRLEEAIADEKRVVERNPTNVHGLTNLTRFHYLRNEHREMRARFEQLQALTAKEWEYQTEPITKMLEAYAVAATDEEIYGFLKQYKKELPSRGHYMLGAAAANLGHRREARSAWKQMGEDGLTWKHQAEDALEALEAGKSGLGRASRFPYFMPYELLSKPQMEVLVRIIEETGDEQERHQAISGVARQHPGLFEAARWFLWNHEDAAPGIRMLGLLGTDAAFAELKGFALGQVGTDQERTQAAHLLSDEGFLSVDQPVRMWLSGEWREILLKKFEITEEPEGLSFSEEVVHLLGRAGEAFHEGDLERAGQFYRDILELDPGCCPAYNNLARIAEQQGDLQGSRAYLEKSLEIDPDYITGRCNLAHLFLLDGEVERAEELIKPLVERERFASFEMKAYQMIQANIRLERGDLKSAEDILRGLTKLYPDDPQVESLIERIGALQPLGNLLEWIRKNNLKKRQRDDSRPLDDQASLETCLHLHTKDGLQSIAGRLGMSGLSGWRKAELVDVLAAHLRDGENVKRTVADLPERPREALEYLLEQGGIVSWEEFGKRYGNDREESPYWQRDEPRTTMGILRVCGLLFVGTAAGEQRVFVPFELRPLLSDSGK